MHRIKNTFEINKLKWRLFLSNRSLKKAKNNLEKTQREIDKQLRGWITFFRDIGLHHIGMDDIWYYIQNVPADDEKISLVWFTDRNIENKLRGEELGKMAMRDYLNTLCHYKSDPVKEAWAYAEEEGIHYPTTLS